LLFKINNFYDNYFWWTYWSTYKLVSKNSQTRKNATLELEKILKISDEQINLKTNSRNFIFENRVGWAFTYLTKAEYIKKTDKKATY
jgi:hypothetical protein